MNQPQVTVVVPVHNTALYLDKCVGSILNQTFTDYELILVNNCSTDNSLEMCRTWASRDSRVRVLDIPVASVAAARNAGIEAAEGHYITFMDSDDWIEPEYLAEFFRTPLPQGNVIVMQGILHDFSEYSGREHKSKILFSYHDAVYRTGDGTEADPKNSFLLYGYNCSLLFDIKLLRRHNIRVRQIAYHEDHIFFFDYLRHVDTVVCRSGIYMHYMMRKRISLSIMSAPSPDALISARLLRDALPDIIEQFNVRDEKYLQLLYRLTLYPVERALLYTGFNDFAPTLREVAEYLPLIQKIKIVRKPLILTPTLQLLLRVPESFDFIPYAYCCWRRFSLRKRGRIV